LAWYVWRNIRFFRQGLWFRRLDPERQAELIAMDPACESYHGRPAATGQLIGAAIGLVIVAALVLAGRTGWF
jgi:hypothetical protein